MEPLIQCLLYNHSLRKYTTLRPIIERRALRLLIVRYKYVIPGQLPESPHRDASVAHNSPVDAGACFMFFYETLHT